MEPNIDDNSVIHIAWHNIPQGENKIEMHVLRDIRTVYLRVIEVQFRSVLPE